MNRLLIAGGGTGGHLFPGVAVAEEFLRRDRHSQVLFVGTGRPVETEVLSRRGLPCLAIRAAGMKGMSLSGRLRSLAALPIGFFQSLGLIFRFKPDLVMGVGGYVSGPVGLAAWLMGVPTAIQEQNSVPGITNRILGRIVDLIFISFESSRRYFPEAKTHLAGNPIRREIETAAESALGSRHKGFTVLIAGGSQGAHAVNVAAVEAVRILKSELPGLKVVHQTGAPDYDQIRAAYEEIDSRFEVRPFFQDMERAYREADLVVCRAGALTLAEIAAMGRPAVFIPLPTAADNHQEINARSLTEIGAAEMLLQKDLTPQSLAEMVLRLASDSEKLRDMGEKARSAAHLNATEKICDLCDEYVQRRTGLK